MLTFAKKTKTNLFLCNDSVMLRLNGNGNLMKDAVTKKVWCIYVTKYLLIKK